MAHACSTCRRCANGRPPRLPNPGVSRRMRTRRCRWARSPPTCGARWRREMPDRLDTLEFKVAHLERALQELSDVMYRQQRELDALRDRQALLAEQVGQLEDRGADPTRV